MAQIHPFAAWRPKADLAAQICELPYDVLSTEEAREIARGNPLSFLRVSKPEIDLANNVNIYDPMVYTHGRENFERLVSSGAITQDTGAYFYLYRQIMGSHTQTGLVAAASCEEYLQNCIKKHELTRPDKEEDRMRHIQALNAQTGPVFLTFRAKPTLKALFSEIQSGLPEVDFAAKDGVRHSAWTVCDPARIQQLKAEFNSVPALYIADGHHRSAAACRIYQERKGAGHSAHFLSVIFPDEEMQILPYNRVLRDLNGMSSAKVLEKLASIFAIRPAEAASPSRKHEIQLFLDNKWFALRFCNDVTVGKDPIETLDVSLLQNLVLTPLFDIDNPRTSKRINFIGGIRGATELERVVRSGEYACAFFMFPTTIADLMTIADAGGIMPPKSTWFEPKLRDGMFSHQI